MAQRNENSGRGDGRRVSILDRRTFLRGVGVTMALPWLESLSGFGTIGSTTASAATAAAATGAAVASSFPKRLAGMFIAHGVNPGNWWAKGGGGGGAVFQ